MKIKLILLNGTPYYFIHIMMAYAETNTTTYDMISLHATECQKADPRESDIGS